MNQPGKILLMALEPGVRVDRVDEEPSLPALELWGDLREHALHVRGTRTRPLRDVVLVLMDERLLQLTHRGQVGAGVDEALHHVRHAAHGQVGAEPVHHGIMHRPVDGLETAERVLHRVQHLPRDADRPAELLEVHGAHHELGEEIRRAVADGAPLRRRRPGITAEIGRGDHAREHVVVAPILDQRPDHGRERGQLLDPIDEHERISALRQLRGEQDQAVEQVLRRTRLGEGTQRILVVAQVDLHEARVLALPEVTDRGALPHPTGTLHEERLPDRAALLLPRLELLGHLAFEHPTALPMMCRIRFRLRGECKHFPGDGGGQGVGREEAATEGDAGVPRDGALLPGRDVPSRERRAIARQEPSRAACQLVFLTSR